MSADAVRPSIIVVEDDPDVLRVLKRLLSSLYPAYEITTAANGAEALEQVRARTVSLVLTDYNMPEMNGLDLSSHIKQLAPQVRVVLITAYATPEVERLARDAGVDYFLPKPFKLDQVEQVLQQALT